VDAQGKERSRIANAAGELVRNADHDGYYQAFDYDAFGATKRIQDSAGNTLQSYSYNVRGMLTASVDMDLGSWSFTPNALGEIVSQTDAKGQIATYSFDLLGRMTTRSESEGTSTWTWGASASAKNIGRVASISGPGFSESYSYDGIGRLSTITIASDTTYQIDYTYNNIGALDTITYPTSTSSYRLKLQHDYQYGGLYRVRDFNSPFTNFWTATGFNARNLVIQETLGNGLVTNRAYDVVTSRLRSIQTGFGGGTGTQNLEYEWDLVGNLKKRKDLNQSTLTEEFFYDNVYRLDYSQLNGVTNLDLAYDALGNITSKSDVGSYTYHSSKKHQVSSTSNGWSFGYDGNGNMTSARNASIVWTSFNYPSSITNGADTASFSYTPARAYWKQVSNYSNGGGATTIYVAQILEKVTTSAGTDYRHMIRAGGASIIVSRQTTGTNSVYYITRDHLGSSSATTDASGGLIFNASFDAYGKRRGSNWLGAPGASDWAAIASTSRRGYTDHTMLDNLDLIHMNGRVHDPLLGRFMSADPYVTEPLNTQNYNRYSYVYNSPLTSVDPSGFDECETSDNGSVDSDSTDGYRNGSTTASGMAECMEEVEVVGRRGAPSTPPYTPPSLPINPPALPQLPQLPVEGGAPQDPDKPADCKNPPVIDTTSDREYDENEENYHDYEVKSLAGWRLTPEQIQGLFDAWRNGPNAAPGAPINTPDYTPVLLGHLPGTADTNWIYMRTGNLSWTNITLPPHRYFPGVVHNSVVTEDDHTWFVSRGVGVTDHKWENIVLGTMIFKLAHKEAIDRFYGDEMNRVGGPFGGPGTCTVDDPPID
jgi:RHS repeat-associated protein